MTGCARHRDGVADNLGGTGDDGLLLIVERLEVLHVGRIVLELLHIAHTAQDGQHAGQRGAVADGP